MLTREFGRYRLTRRLGRGGMADVYLARDTEHGRDVALKLLEIHPDRDSQEVFDAERRGAALQEAFGAVDTHVPAVHASGTIEGHFYLDMEYVEGEDLTERLARGPLPPDEAVRIALEVCDFLERTEPSHPAPLLIRRAARLLDLSFVDIIRDLAPDAAGQIENLGGLRRE